MNIIFRTSEFTASLLKNIPKAEYDDWLREFLQLHKSKLNKFSKKEIEEEFYSWIEHLKDLESRNETKVLKDLDLHLSIKKFIDLKIKEI